MIGPKSDEDGVWKRFHNEEIHSLCRSVNAVKVIKSIRWTDDIARMEEGRSTLKILTSKPTEKRPLGSPKRR